jgi:DNA-binding GntR family transcriptional regulator
MTLLLSHPKFSSRSPSTATEKVMEGIRAMLISGALPPGTRIDQIELTRRFDVSIVPIREALARLASVGLVEIISRRGVFVAKVSADELIDLYTMREVVEEQAARIAVDRLTDADLQALSKIADEMSIAARKQELDRFMVLNRELHFTIYRASKRRYMLQMIEQMWDLSARYAHLQLHAVPNRAVQSLDEVRAIVAACHRRDSADVALNVRYKLHQTSVGLLERMHLPERAESQPQSQSQSQGAKIKAPKSKKPTTAGHSKARKA